LGTLLFIVLVILVLAVLLGAGGYSVRRYWSPAGSEVVETSETTGGGAGAGIAAAILALLVLILLFFGFTQWNWFGARSTGAPANNPTVASPAPTSNTGPGGGTAASPAASPSASP
jgi:flagellar basal body-associated protein FliL